MRDLIKDLEWIEEDLFVVASTPMYEYRIEENSGKYEVDYTDLNIDAPYVPYEPATGFTTLDQAKEWAFNHHCEKLSRWLNPDPLTDTVNWFKTAKSNPTFNDAMTQTGCHIEEVCEFLDAMGDRIEAHQLRQLADWYKKMEFKERQRPFTNSVEVLDSLADQIVTAVGVAYMMGFDIIGALTEVNASNWSKFVDGKAVTDENGKIIKGEGYFKPELDKFVGG